MTCSTPTTPSWPWAWHCCAPATSTPRSTSSRCGTATTTPAMSARRLTWRHGRQAGHRSVVVDPGLGSREQTLRVQEATRGIAASRDGAMRRVVRSMLMGDIRGYSKLSEDQLRLLPVVLGSFADVLSRYRRKHRVPQHLG